MNTKPTNSKAPPTIGSDAPATVPVCGSSLRDGGGAGSSAIAGAPLAGSKSLSLITIEDLEAAIEAVSATITEVERRYTVQPDEARLDDLYRELECYESALKEEKARRGGAR